MQYTNSDVQLSSIPPPPPQTPRIVRPEQLIDYGYIQDVEVDSDDEYEEEEEEGQGQGQGEEVMPTTQDAQAAEEPAAEEPAGAAAAAATGTDPSLEQPSADGDGGGDGDRDGGAPAEGVVTPEEEAEPEDPAEPRSPSAGAAGLAAGAGAEAKGSDGAQQPRFGPQRMFMDEVVERVCDCDLETEEVQLQVIKALVHACTATTLAVHQASLLTAVKTIYTVSGLALPRPCLAFSPLL